MRAALPQSESRLTPILALVGAMLLAGGLFLLIPLTQTLDAQPREILEYREVAVAAPPPPKPPPPSARSEASLQPAPDKPQMPPSPPQIEISQLEISLNPGMGASLAMGVQQVQFDAAIDVIAEIEKIFEFEELTQKPSLLNKPQPKFPPDLARRGVREIRATVVAVIDERGSTTLEAIDSITHPNTSAEDAVEATVNRMRFTTTRIDGKPVKVRVKFPLVFKR